MNNWARNAELFIKSRWFCYLWLIQNLLKFKVLYSHFPIIVFFFFLSNLWARYFLQLYDLVHAAFQLFFRRLLNNCHAKWAHLKIFSILIGTLFISCMLRQLLTTLDLRLLSWAKVENLILNYNFHIFNFVGLVWLAHYYLRLIIFLNHFNAPLLLSKLGLETYFFYQRRSIWLCLLNLWDYLLVELNKISLFVFLSQPLILYQLKRLGGYFTQNLQIYRLSLLKVRAFEIIADWLLSVKWLSLNWVIKNLVTRAWGNFMKLWRVWIWRVTTRRCYWCFFVLRNTIRPQTLSWGSLRIIKFGFFFLLYRWLLITKSLILFVAL